MNTVKGTVGKRYRGDDMRTPSRIFTVQVCGFPWGYTHRKGDYRGADPMALVGFSVTTGFGASIGTPALVCLIIHCGKIISTLLNVPTVHAECPKIEDRK